MALQKENRIFLKNTYLKILDSIFLLHLPPALLPNFSQIHLTSLPSHNLMFSLVWVWFYYSSLAPSYTAYMFIGMEQSSTVSWWPTRSLQELTLWEVLTGHSFSVRGCPSHSSSLSALERCLAWSCAGSSYSRSKFMRTVTLTCPKDTKTKLSKAHTSLPNISFQFRLFVYDLNSLT